jgi:hypothetical protein
LKHKTLETSKDELLETAGTFSVTSACWTTPTRARASTPMMLMPMLTLNLTVVCGARLRHPKHI